MKKAIFATTFLAASLTAAPFARVALAQTPVNTGGAQQGPTLGADEYTAYNAVITATDNATKATAAEAFLSKYPQSSVKASVLEQMLAAYAAANNASKALEAADRLLQEDQNNLRALAIATSLAKAQGDGAGTDAAARGTAYAKAASYATRGLQATKPAATAQTDWDALRGQVLQYFYSAIGIDALTRKDYVPAISAYTSELKAVPLAATQAPGPVLQDTYFLAQAYYSQATPDYLSCTFYATRTAGYAPDQFKSSFQPLATYCYKKFHGAEDGYDAVKTVAAANLFPPSDYATSVKPAPTPADTVKQVLDTTPDLTKLALGDVEYILQNGTADQAEKVFAAFKDKESKVPGKVVSVSDTSISLAVSDDAKQATPSVADFTIALKEAPKALPAVGSTVAVDGTFASYTQTPLMITMTGGEIESKAAPKAPARRPAPGRRR